jgi:hypothetical protein
LRGELLDRRDMKDVKGRQQKGKFLTELTELRNDQINGIFEGEF